MNVYAALMAAGRKGTISSEETSFLAQDARTLMYWLAGDVDATEEKKLERLKEILNADDWTFERKRKRKNK